MEYSALLLGIVGSVLVSALILSFTVGFVGASFDFLELYHNVEAFSTFTSKMKFAWSSGSSHISRWSLEAGNMGEGFDFSARFKDCPGKTSPYKASAGNEIGDVFVMTFIGDELGDSLARDYSDDLSQNDQGVLRSCGGKDDNDVCLCLLKVEFNFGFVNDKGNECCGGNFLVTDKSVPDFARKNSNPYKYYKAFSKSDKNGLDVVRCKRMIEDLNCYYEKNGDKHPCYLKYDGLNVTWISAPCNEIKPSPMSFERVPSNDPRYIKFDMANHPGKNRDTFKVWNNITVYDHHNVDRTNPGKGNAWAPFCGATSGDPDNMITYVGVGGEGCDY